MQCSAYCTGEAYNLSAISEFCQKFHYVHKIYGNDVLHILPDTDFAPSIDIFVHNYGCVVMWGELDFAKENDILKKLEVFLTKPLAIPIIERCHYMEVSSEEMRTYIDAENDTIILDSGDPYTKLSFSYGMSQSAKLSMFEDSVEQTIGENRHIPHTLIETGKISLSRKELARKIGVLFLEKDFINLHSDILDTPDFFWKRPQYEPFYEMSVKFFDIKQRVDILNGRLNIIHELYEIIHAELKHAYSSRLELIIISLIFIEVILSLLKDVLKLF